MLPKRGLPYEQLADIIRRPEAHWQRMCNRFPFNPNNPTAPCAVRLLEELSKNPIVIDALEDMELFQWPSQQITIKKALILLDCALGQDIVKIFFGLQREETVIGMFELARCPRPPDPAIYEGKDIQMSIMTMVFDHLCYHAGGRNPKWYVYDMLNRIHMGWAQHDVVLKSALKRLETQPKTIQ